VQIRCPIQIFVGKETAPIEGFLAAVLWIVALCFLLKSALKRGIQGFKAVGK